MATKKVLYKISETGAKKTEQSIGGVNKSIMGMAKAAGVALVSYQALSKGLKATVGASIKQEEIFRKLQTSTELAGKKWKDAKGELDGLFASLQATTRYGDTDSAQMLTKLIEFTGDYETAVKNLPLVLDMASTSMFDAQSASRYLGMALSGNVEMLGRYIPELKTSNNELLKNMTNAEKAEYTMKLLNEKFGGSAQKDLETTAGKWEKLGNYIGDIGEAAGDKVTPAIDGLLDVTTTWLQELSESTLETAVRQLKEMGIEAEKLAGLQKALSIEAAVGNLGDVTNELGKLFQSSLNFTAAETKAITGMVTAYERKKTFITAEQINIEAVNELIAKQYADISKIASKGGEITATDNKILKYKAGHIVKLENILSLVESQKIAQDVLNNAKAGAVETEETLNGEIIKQVETVKTLKEEALLLGATFDNIKFPALTSAEQELEINPIEDLLMTEQEKANITQQFRDAEFELTLGHFEQQKMLLDVELQNYRDAGIEQTRIDKIESIKRVKIAQMELQAKLGAVSGLAGALSQLASQSKEHGKIAKAMAKAQAIIDTYAGATSAFKSMAGIPYVGPALGAIAAATAIAAGMANVAQINAQQFATGGIVPGSGSGDTVPAMLTPGEVILNAGQQKNVANQMTGTTINIQGDFLGSEEQADKLAFIIEQRSKQNFNNIAVN